MHVIKGTIPVSGQKRLLWRGHGFDSPACITSDNEPRNISFHAFQGKFLTKEVKSPVDTSMNRGVMGGGNANPSVFDRGP